MTKRVLSILGSTGSIGRSTLAVVRHLSSEFTIGALAAKSQIKLLYEQALEFRPKLIAVYEEEAAALLREQLPHVSIVSGLSGLREVAAYTKTDLVVSALCGTVGILPTITALEAGKHVALANKEALVSAGEYIMQLAQKRGVRILPIDSEHSALFQCLEGAETKQVRRLILTASGGPFLHTPLQELKKVNAEKALQHPTWNMGPKVTIDSSTLMNKGLEVIEAYHLFGVSIDQITVVIHPQSIIHSMVEFVDGSILAQMSQPNMISPIQYALTYPDRRNSSLSFYDFSRPHHLEFLPPDLHRFPCLDLAFQALRKGGVTPAFLNAANEVLVERFLQGEFHWHQIAVQLSSLVAQCPYEDSPSLEKILETDRLARGLAYA